MDKVNETMQREFTLDWPHGHTTREGHEVRIIDTNFNGCAGESIVAVVQSKQNKERVITNHANGRYLDISTISEEDLINKPAPPKQVVYYVNLYKDGDGFVHACREAADQLASERRIARKRIVVTEGEYDD